MGCTKDLNEVTKILKSLILSLHAAGKQRKDIASHVGCSKASVSCVINAVALKGWAACGKQKKTILQDDSFAGLSRPIDSREPLNSPKSGVVLWGEKSLLQPPFIVSGRWASVGKHAQRLHKDAQKWSSHF